MVSSHLFGIADVENLGKLSGPSAVKFLVKTGLDRSILRQIWELSDTQKQHALGPNEFQVTLRYVCLSQNGHVLSDNVLQETKELVLPDPKFEGIDMPSLVDKTEETNKDMGTNNTDNGGITGMDAFASLVPSMPEPVMDMNVAMPDPNLVSSVNMVDENTSIGNENTIEDVGNYQIL